MAIIIRRAGWVLGLIGLVGLILGCAHMDKWPVENQLFKAKMIRDELRQDPEAETVETELVDSEAASAEATVLLEKARQRPMLDPDGLHQMYYQDAATLAKKSLTQAQAARDKLHPREEAKESPWSQPDSGRVAPPKSGKQVAMAPEMKVEEEEVTAEEGPPGPLTQKMADESAPESAQEPAQESAPESAQEPAQEPTQEPAQSPTMGSGAQEVETPAAQVQAPQAESPVGVYAAGLELYRQGEYAQSRTHLLDFLDRFGDHRLAVNAQYWIGETYYAEAEYVMALGAFETVVDRYPQGLKVPDALLKIGLSEARLGREVKAAEALKECISRYPESAPAAIAQKRLRRMGH